LTDETPKPLLPIKGKPILEHTMLNLKKYGITEIILSVGFRADKIQDYFQDGSELGLDIKYCIEDAPLGTGGAIKLASESISETFIALNGDNMADFNYHEAILTHKSNQALITIGLFPVEDVTKFGIADLKGDKIIKFIEKPTVAEAPTNLNNAGLYIIEPDVLKILPDGKSSIERDCFEKLCGPEGRVYAYRHNGQWFPTDDLEKYQKTDREFMSKL